MPLFCRPLLSCRGHWGHAISTAMGESKVSSISYEARTQPNHWGFLQSHKCPPDLLCALANKFPLVLISYSLTYLFILLLVFGFLPPAGLQVSEGDLIGANLETSTSMNVAVDCVLGGWMIQPCRMRTMWLHFTMYITRGANMQTR